jgi:transcriptional regulator with XRE-family HTH domain
LVCAAEALRQEADPIAAENERWLQKARELRDQVGGRNKLAKLLGVTGPYLGRVLRGENPITAKLIERLNGIRI